MALRFARYTALLTHKYTARNNTAVVTCSRTYNYTACNYTFVLTLTADLRGEKKRRKRKKKKKNLKAHAVAFITVLHALYIL